MAALYEISKAYEEVLNRAIDHDTGEIRSAELERELDAIEGKLEEKALDIAAFIVDLEAEAAKVKARALQLTARARAIDNKATWLRRYLAQHLEVGTKLSDDRVSFNVQAPSQRAEIPDARKLPEQYKRIEVTPLRELIRKDLLAGKEIPGATLVDGERSVRIR